MDDGVAKKMGKLEEAYLRSSRAVFRLGTNNGGSSATPRDWVTLKASSTPWDFVTDQFDACQLEVQRPAPALADLFYMASLTARRHYCYSDGSSSYLSDATRTKAKV